jgi:hypothetical protein
MIEFDWPVLQSYCWGDYFSVGDDLAISPKKTRALVLDAAGKTSPRKSFPLSAEQDLFAEFAQLKVTEDAILRFAKQHGALSGHGLFVISRIDSSRVFRGDSIDLWVENIVAMNRAYHLWTLAFRTSPDPRLLGCYIHWSDRSVRYETPNGEYSEIIAHRIESPEVFRCFNKRDLVQPAKYFVAKMINSRIDGLVSPVLRLRGEDIETQFRPRNLLGALWYQFFSAVRSGEPVQLKPCEKCGTPIRAKRSTKRICGECSKKGRDATYRKNHGRIKSEQ